MRISAELALLTRCCASAYGGAPPAPHDLADVNWRAFLSLARFHRVEGLAWQGASAIKDHIPAAVAANLARDSAQIAAHNLRSAQEAHRLLQLFSAARVPLIFIKGLTLGMLGYGDPWVKTAVDIDLLIAPADLTRATEILCEAGYSPIRPLSPARLAAAHRWGKESSWVHAGTGLHVDLHTRLADNPRVIPSIGLESPRQLVHVAGEISLPTLSDAFLIPYLAVHGASSAWFRLKWIVDFAAMLHRTGPDALAGMYDHARSLGTGRAIDQALLVADALLGSLSETPELKARLLAERANRWLARAALRMLAAADPKEPTEATLGTLPIHYTQLLLRDDLAFRLSEIYRQGRAALTR